MSKRQKTNLYDNMTDKYEYEKMINMEKPLVIEAKVIKHCPKFDNNKTEEGFDYKEEEERIRSGYYLNIHECIHILKLHNPKDTPNPFANIMADGNYSKYFKNFQNSAQTKSDSSNTARTDRNFSANKAQTDRNNCSANKAQTDRNNFVPTASGSAPLQNSTGNEEMHFDQVILKEIQSMTPEEFYSLTGKIIHGI